MHVIPARLHVGCSILAINTSLLLSSSHHTNSKNQRHTRTASTMLCKNTMASLVFLVALLLSCSSMSSATRHLEEAVPKEYPGPAHRCSGPWGKTTIRGPLDTQKLQVFYISLSKKKVFCITQGDKICLVHNID